MKENRRKLPKAATASTQGPLSVWPNLNRHPEMAQSLLAHKGFLLFFQDLLSQRAANAEILIRSTDDKRSDQIRGGIVALDHVLALPEAVENWKKQQ
jgi:hypothetical protein